ncbi:MAG: hypothetical protein OHK0048_18480 [Rhodoferax sp.]
MNEPSATPSMPPDARERLRAQALERLPPCEPSLKALPPEQLALLEDLRIHQIELELQNEELRQAQQYADLARQRYQALFEQLPFPALVLDHKGAVQDYNAAAGPLLQSARSIQGPAASLLRGFNVADRGRLLQALRNTASGRHHALHELKWTAPGTSECVFDAHLMGLSTDYQLDPHGLLLLIDRSAEMTLRAQQRLSARMLDASDSLIYALDTEGRITLANQSLLTALGLTREAVIGQTRQRVFPPVQAVHHSKSDNRVLREGLSLSFEESLHSMAQRAELALLTHKFPLFDERGAVSGVGVISTDVALLKERQREALLSETVFQTCDEAILITDAQARIVRINPAFTRQSGFTAQAVLGANPRILKSGQHDAAFYQALWDTLLREGHWSGELTNRRSDGQNYTVLMSISRVTDGQGGLLHYIGISTDITQRQQLQKLATHHAEVLRAALDAVGEGFTLFDDQDRLVLCNQRYREIYTCSADLLQEGRRFEDIIRSGAERGQYAAALGRVDEWVTERLALHRQTESQCLQTLDGGRLIQTRERRMANGYTVGFHFDVTELVLATQEAQAANQAKSRFLATMSHEIRTPMNGILGMAQLLQQPGLSEAERRAYLNTLLDSGQSLLRLLNDILDLSRVESGRLTLEQTAVRPSHLIEDVRSLFAVAARAKGLALQAHWVGDAEPIVLGDELRLRQMLSNLVGNAIKFTERGEVQITAQRPTDADDDGRITLEFAVLDTGPGLAEEAQAQLFQPFSRPDDVAARRHGGAGLGLSIVKSLAQAMDGAVGVQSRPGAGSRFWFSVRLKPAPIEATEPAQPPTARDRPLDRLSGRVLVVEDNPVNAQVVRLMLTQFGLDVLQAEDGQRALDLIQQEKSPPDLILMDLQMPNVDGFEATRRIRQLEAQHGWPRCPILALTANAFAQDRQKCLDAGMDDHLSKPVILDELKAVLQRWLPRRDPAQQAIPQSGPTETGGFDPTAFASALQTLRGLLRERRFDALASFDELRRRAQGSAYGPQLAALVPALNRLDFDAVEQGLSTLPPARHEPDPQPPSGR